MPTIEYGRHVFSSELANDLTCLLGIIFDHTWDR
jgi:hypothetical protein